VDIFESFFGKASCRIRATYDSVHKYVALLPILCVDVSEHVQYTCYLKQIMISLLVNYASAPKGTSSFDNLLAQLDRQLLADGRKQN
jgi:hypothetical protein